MEEEVTVAEINGALLKVSTDVVAAERKLLDYHQAQGVFYPLIQVASTPPPSSSAAGSPPPPSSPDGGANGASLQLQASIAATGGLVLLILSGRGWDNGDAGLWNGLLSGAFFACFVLYLTVQAYPHLRRPLDNALLDLLRLRDESPSLATPCAPAVQGFAWHPHLNRFAVALRDGTTDYIALYDMDKELWLPTVLKHQFLRGVTCLQFQPNSGGSLAVGCAGGVCLWKLEPSRDPGGVAGVRGAEGGGTQGGQTADAAWMTFRHKAGFARVTDIAWSACGRHLAAGYASSDRAIVWDAVSGQGRVLDSFLPLAWLGASAGGVRFVRWAPAGNMVAVGLSNARLLCLYETLSWTWHAHRTEGTLHDATFSPNGRYLLGAANTRSSGSVWCYPLQARAPATHVSRGYKVQLWKTASEASPPIRALAWSPTGERLAVVFAAPLPPDDSPPADATEGSAASACLGERASVALFLTECNSQTANIRAVFRGWIRPPPGVGGKAAVAGGGGGGGAGVSARILVAFRATFRRSMGHQQRLRPDGALLTTCWPGGRISNYPLYFASLDGGQNKPWVGSE